MLNIILFGPPGAGKGTQSEKIIEKYDLFHISTGDLFRKHMGEGTDLGKLAQEYIDEGNLVPDELVIKMVKVKIQSHENAKGFIFDGFPRTVAQAVALDEMLTSQGLNISGMLALEVEDEELRSRIRLRGKTSGRADDQNDERINNRIKIYKQETLPVADHYAMKGKYHGINGTGSIDEIFNHICMVIDLIK
ncbi:MAG: adenylate kinase [Cyclobacteriaceae bacterium]|nr:adenylate kinase [Cyclobacteriaceae bacterium]